MRTFEVLNGPMDHHPYLCLWPDYAAYIANSIEHIRITNIHFDVLCICGVYSKSVRAKERDLSSVALLQVFTFSPKMFFFLLSFS